MNCHLRLLQGISVQSLKPQFWAPLRNAAERVSGLMFFLSPLFFAALCGCGCQVCAQSGTITAEALQSVPGSTEEQAAPRWGKCTSGKSNTLFLLWTSFMPLY